MPPSSSNSATVRLAAALFLAAAAGSASAQLRISSWNVSNYNGTGREAAFQTAVYGQYLGRSFRPDILIGQEFTSAAAVGTFVALLNSAPGSPGDWQAAPFVDGNDTDNAFFYRSSKVEYLGTTVVILGGNDPLPPRDVLRYDVRPVGYTADTTVIACYGSHMKAGSTANDQQRRLVEATAIRNNANALPAGWNFLIGGDFNIQSSSQAAYQQLIGPHANNRGRFFDPVATPGSWNNNSAFRFMHTQSPGASGGAGMDDRFDFLLLSDSLSDRLDFDYIGDRAVPYSTSTWNDPTHSFRVWGNDGTTYNQPIAVAGNGMVGPVIAQAIRDVTATDNAGGHLPVFLDLRVPAVTGAVQTLDLGVLPLGGPGSTASGELTIENAADTALWTTAGIAPLVYELQASPGLEAPAGAYTLAPGMAHAQTIRVSTASPGPFSGTITILSTSSETPVRVVTVTGTVAAACYANCDGSTAPPALNVADFTCFLQRFAASESYANCDQSTAPPVLNVADFTCFLSAFAAGCP